MVLLDALALNVVELRSATQESWATDSRMGETAILATVGNLFKGPLSLAPGKLIKYSVRIENPTAPKEIARIEAIVAGKPDHPQRADLADLRGFARPRTVDYTYWYGGADLFRFCSDRDYDPDLPYEDGAVGPAGAWRLMRDQMELGLSKVGAEWPDGQHRLLSDAMSQFAGHGASYIPGGLKAVRVTADAVREGPGALAGRSWAVEAGSSDGVFAAIVRGESTMVDGHERHLVNEIQFLRPPDVFAPRIRMQDWRLTSTGELLAHRVIRHERSGKISTYELRSVVPVDQAAIVEHCTLPRLEVADPVRGVPTVRTIVDNTGNEALFRNLANGETVPISAPAEAPEAPVPGWIGPVGVAGLIVTLVVFAILRVRKTS